MKLYFVKLNFQILFENDFKRIYFKLDKLFSLKQAEDFDNVGLLLWGILAREVSGSFGFVMMP